MRSRSDPDTRLLSYVPSTRRTERFRREHPNVANRPAGGGGDRFQHAFAKVVLRLEVPIVRHDCPVDPWRECLQARFEARLSTGRTPPRHKAEGDIEPAAYVIPKNPTGPAPTISKGWPSNEMVPPIALSSCFTGPSHHTDWLAQ